MRGSHILFQYCYCCYYCCYCLFLSLHLIFFPLFLNHFIILIAKLMVTNSIIWCIHFSSTIPSSPSLLYSPLLSIFPFISSPPLYLPLLLFSSLRLSTRLHRVPLHCDVSRGRDGSCNTTRMDVKVITALFFLPAMSLLTIYICPTSK